MSVVNCYPMGTTLNTDQIHKLSELKKAGKTIVLVGGCFDILHAAHVEFLKTSKKHGNLLVVLLESDKRIKELKGEARPVNSQMHRVSVLSHLPFVDYVIPLAYLSHDRDYEILVKTIEPDIIAVTAGNTVFDWEKDYSKGTGTKIVEVMERRPNHSTTAIVNKIKL